MADPVDPYDPASSTPWPPPPDWLHSPYTTPEHIDAMFAGVHPDAPIPVDALHPHIQSALGIPDATLDAAANAPAVPYGPQGAPSALGPEAAPTHDAPADQQVGTVDVDAGRFVPNGPAPGAFGPMPDHLMGDMLSPVTTEAQPVGPDNEAAEATGIPSIDEREDEKPSELSRYSGADLLKLYQTDPEKVVGMFADAETEKANHFARAKQKADEEYVAQKQRDLDNYNVAKGLAEQQTREIGDRMEHLAKVDPDRLLNSRSAGTKVADMIGLIAGGVQAGQVGGPNHYLEMLNGKINQDIDAQKANIESDRQTLNTKRSMVAEEFARTGNLFQATETVRAAMHQAAIDKLVTDSQLYDPAGTKAANSAKAILALRAQQQQHAQAVAQTLFKNNLDSRKADNTDAETAIKLGELQLKRDEFNAKQAKAGAGQGGPTNADYTVPTGFFDPFTGQPVMAKRAIGGKGEDPKERNAVDAQIRTYGHVQDYWKKLADIGAKIDYHKSLGESAWSGFKDTDGAEYDAAREALTVYLTKELGDKLTTGQLEAQAHRIPQRTSLLESRDAGKQIADAQADADRDFVRDMNITGVAGEPIVRSAQAMRRPPTPPDPQQALGDAQDALSKARTPKDRKDAQALVDVSTSQLAAQKERQSHAQQAIANAEHAQPYANIDGAGLPPGLAAEIDARNLAAKHHGEHIAKYHADASQPLKPPKAAGEAAQAKKAHEDKVAASALDVADARAAVDEANRKVAKSLAKTLTEKDFGGLPRAKVDAIASRLDFDPKKFGDDPNGQVEVGKFRAAIDHQRPENLMKAWFGNDVFHAKAHVKAVKK